MQRLSGTDAGFLYGETAAWHMHAGAVVLLDPSTGAGGFGVEAVRDLVRHRLPQLGLLRYRATAPPLGIGGSHWVEVPDVDLDVHVQAASLPAPGGMAELAAFVAEVLSHQLDRRRPLWQMWLVDGLEGGRFALVIKVHHACVDGVRATQIYEALFDLTADAPLARTAETVRSVRRPATRVELLCGAARGIASAPLRIGRALRAFTIAGAHVGNFARSGERNHVTVPFTAPRSPFNGVLTAARSVAFCSMPIDDVRTIRKAHDVAFNDVVLAACTGAIRRSMMKDGVTPTGPLIAQVPIGVHRDGESPDLSAVPGNFVSAMAALLPVHLADPLAQLEAIHESTDSGKALHHVLGEDFLLDVVGAVPSALISVTVRAYLALHLEQLLAPIFNVLVSNVPGTSFPVYCAGVPVVATFPLGPLLAGGGLNITVFSYVDRLYAGLVACPDIVADIDVIAEGVPAALDELVAATKRRDQ
ncbi:MAG TPA: wax ester/triacylglycerol synthase family O-acyltransferase [Acidimicrobiia bacterium]|nr:wax ester/triacylglycerol synthase family O-acyltransferase [Acidimicrobiia bacterium]